MKWLPTLPELFFIALLVWLFATGDGWSVLLADGDTGWHIRNGQQILQCRCIPRVDPFAFGTAGRPWFAWEWLSDVWFALLYGLAGLRAIAFFAGVAIAAAFAIVIRHCLWRGANPFVALPVALLATGASSVHFLARPHVITLLLLAVCAWLVDCDRRQNTGWVWALPPLVTLWCNLHGGFLVVFPLLGAAAVAANFEKPRRWPRDMALLGLCGLATLINPYGWHLHAHVWAYLHSDWIRASIQEFQSPQFRSAGLLQFEVLLGLGLLVTPSLVRRREWAGAALVLFWAHQALGSVRHVPIYCVTAAPYLASELDWLWAAWGASHARLAGGNVLRRAGAGWTAWSAGVSAAPALLCGALFLLPLGRPGPADFPANKFPAAMVDRNWSRLGAIAGAPHFIFSSDQWSDYLIYRRYPAVRVFFDGRSDFFGPWRGEDYGRLMQGAPGCLKLLRATGARWALVPADWPLAAILDGASGWSAVDRDPMAILFRCDDASEMKAKLARPNRR